MDHEDDPNRHTPNSRRERRAMVRVGIRVRVRLTGAAGLTITGWARNISLGGIFVESQQQFPPGSECALEFPLRDGHTAHTLRPLARVAWRGETGMGLEFLKVSDEARTFIRRLVERDGVPLAPDDPDL